MPTLTKTTLGSFCRELVLQLSPIPDLLNDWGLTEEQYEELRASTFFQNELIAAVEEIKAMGPDAGFITRCKILAEDALPTMVGLMTNNNTPPETKVALFDKLTELARLKPVKQQADVTTKGPLVTFTFGAGMPGLPVSVDVTPTQQQIEEK